MGNRKMRILYRKVNCVCLRDAETVTKAALRVYLFIYSFIFLFWIFWLSAALFSRIL